MIMFEPTTRKTQIILLLSNCVCFVFIFFISYLLIYTLFSVVARHCHVLNGKSIIFLNSTCFNSNLHKFKIFQVFVCMYILLISHISIALLCTALVSRVALVINTGIFCCEQCKHRLRKVLLMTFTIIVHKAFVLSCMLVIIFVDIFNFIIR